MDIICEEKTEPTVIRRTYVRGIETGIHVLDLLGDLEQTTIDGPGAFLFSTIRRQFRHLVGALCFKHIDLHTYQLTISVIIHKRGDSLGIHAVEKKVAVSSA